MKMTKAIAIPYDMNKKHFVMMMFFVFGLLSIFGCGGGGGDKGGTDPLVCAAPFVPNNSGTACICPTGTHPEGSTCVTNTTPDTTPPTVFITAPANNATVSGNLSLTASVVDDHGVAEVILVVDGSQTGNTFTESPANIFTTNVNTTSLGNGSHTLKVCAIDTSSNTGCSANLTVTVNNTTASANWAAVTSPTTSSLSSVWGSGSNDVWAVGSNGVIVHWNGTAWAAVTSPTTSSLSSVWGSGSNDVWAVGLGGIIIRYNQ
jgi:hypothetical protein